MNKLPIKLNDLSPIIISLIEKIQLLNSNFITKQQKLDANKELTVVVDSFREFFVKALSSVEVDEHIKIFKERIERAFSQFEWDSNVAVSPYEFKKFSENGVQLVSSILKLLGTKGCGVLIIETYLKLCMKSVLTMTENSNNTDLSENRTNYKSLLDSFLMTATMLQKYWHIALLPNQKSTIILCLNQICKDLTFLLKMIEVQNSDIKKYTLNLLIKCLTKIQDEIHSDGNFQSKDSDQEFIKLMDFCLYKLNEISNSTNEFLSFIEKANETVVLLKPAIDEVLGYAMSISQITNFENDCSAIMSGSQKVLRQLSDLTAAISEENSCAVKLNAGSLGEALCSLEHQINTAVLRLVLEVFSGVNTPLKNIVNKCRTDIGKNNKTSEDLNLLISDFDSEMDKIMQIGFFTISCTSNLNKILGIKSCLVSLESLEVELVPSLTALYVDCNAKSKANFQYLIDFWLNEITQLKILIDSILDPAGFCGVVQSQVKSLVKDFKEDLSSSNFSTNKGKSILKQMIQYSRKLIKTLKTSMEDDNTVIEKIEEHFNKFKRAVQECEAVLNLLDSREDNNKTMERAIKRCDFLLETLNKLTVNLFDLVSNEETETDSIEKSVESTLPHELKIPQKNYYKLCDSPESFTSPKNLEILTPYINKGILLSKKRNVLYPTPSKVEELKKNFDDTLLQARYWDKTPVSRKRSRCCKPLSFNTELENTIDLEITTILENISEINNTFCKTLNPGTQTHCDSKKTDGKVEKKKSDVACGMEKDTDYTKPTYSSSGCCAKMDSEENEKSANEMEENEGENSSIGNKIRNRFLQSLNDLSQNTSLLITKDTDTTNSDFDTPQRLCDLKVVDERINFLKQQVPDMLP